jgi:peptidoglycan LD-endopeptidase LytH
MSRQWVGIGVLLIAGCRGGKEVALKTEAVDTLVGIAADTTQSIPAAVRPISPADTATKTATTNELTDLAGKLIIPVQGVAASQLRDSYTSARQGHVHEALDIMSARGTPVLSATDGRLIKLHGSVAGGNMIYAADASDQFILMYGHLDRYADGISEKMLLKRGQIIGYVGSTGNAPETAPHLHFAIARGHPSIAWWKGEPVNPYPLLTGSPVVASAVPAPIVAPPARPETSVTPKAMPQIHDSVRTPATKPIAADVPATTTGLSSAAAKKLIATKAASAVAALKAHDLAKLSGIVDSTKGLRFSPYQHVDTKNDRVLTKGQLKAAWASKKVSVWGTHDGSGAPMRLTYPEYHKAFVYDYDFSKASKVAYNADPIGRGNTPNNIAATYPDAIIVEYHSPGVDPKLEGMDWKSLWLVFQKRGSTWYLVGIVHGAWTI